MRAKGTAPLRYRHVMLDEVQDFSPLEVHVLLGCLGPRPSITLAGDTQQHVMQDAGFTSWAEFFGHLGVKGTEVNTLKVAYRSTREIVEFARPYYKRWDGARFNDLLKDFEIDPRSRVESLSRGRKTLLSLGPLKTPLLLHLKMSLPSLKSFPQR